MAGIWPRLKQGKRRTRSATTGKARANPYAASGLEKFAALLQGIQAQRGASLVEHTASSLSAARSISRSVQEWTAATLNRPLQGAAFEALAHQPPPVVECLEKDGRSSSENRAGVQGVVDSSSPRRLTTKISSRLKKLKLFRSPPTSSASAGSHHSNTTSEPDSPTSSSRLSNPDRRRVCPFSRRLQKTKSSDVVPELAQNEDSTSRKCIVMRRQRSSDSRTLSSEAQEECTLTASSPSSAASSLHGKSPSSRNGTAEASPRDDVFWPLVGVLVILLFLLVGRFPAIMATALFIVVVSDAHQDRAHPRGRGRDDRALEAARKLQRSPPRRR